MSLGKVWTTLALVSLSVKCNNKIMSLSGLCRCLKSNWHKVLDRYLLLGSSLEFWVSRGFVKATAHENPGCLYAFPRKWAGNQQWYWDSMEMCGKHLPCSRYWATYLWPSLGILGGWVPRLLAKIEIHECSSPLYKMMWCLQITYAPPPKYLQSSLNYL